MFGDVNKAGKMLQDRLAAVPPATVGRIVEDARAIAAAGREILETAAAALRRLREPAEAQK